MWKAFNHMIKTVGEFDNKTFEHLRGLEFVLKSSLVSRYRRNAQTEDVDPHLESGQHQRCPVHSVMPFDDKLAIEATTMVTDLCLAFQVAQPRRHSPGLLRLWRQRRPNDCCHRFQYLALVWKVRQNGFEWGQTPIGYVRVSGSSFIQS